MEKGVNYLNWFEFPIKKVLGLLLQFPPLPRLEEKKLKFN